MPYMREKTWIQMAPRIPGLSLRESQRGMGQACYDTSGNPIDCGGAAAGLTIANPSAYTPGLPSLPGYQASLPSSDLLATNAAGVPYSPAYPTTFMNWLQNNGSVVLLAGAGLLGLVFLSKLK